MVKGSKVREAPELIWDEERMCYQVPLTKGKFALVSKCDAALVAGIKWHYLNAGYAKNDAVDFMHRMLLQAERGMHVDHINGDTLDNRRSNLRLCTPEQNRFNLRKMNRKNSRSQYRGVGWCSSMRTRNWSAQITCKNVDYQLGFFATEESAAHAYNEKAKELYGEYARLNVINDWRAD